MSLTCFSTPKLFMSYENPTGCYPQGFAIYQKYGFMLFHTGMCCVYNLETRMSKPIAVFKLSSYNAGSPDKKFANHANQAMFLGTEPAPDSDFPYLMVTVGNSGEKTNDGYIVRASIERINRDFSCTAVHTFIFSEKDKADYSFDTIGWGWPAFSMDVENRLIYILSARHRTIREEFNKYGENNYIITKIAIPDNITGTQTILSHKDIVDRFECEFDIFFTQGGMFHNGLLYHSFGCREAYPAGIRVFDPNKGDWVYKLDLGDTVIGKQEMEACSYYKDMLLCSTDKGNIYVVGRLVEE